MRIASESKIEKYKVKGKEGGIVFDGRESSKEFAHLLSVRVLSGKGRLEPPILWLDGDNSFNPYQISELARGNGLNEDEALKNVYISRAFTCYQMMSLIFERVKDVIERLKAGLTVITGIPRLFCESDLSKEEALKAIEPLMGELEKLRENSSSIFLTSEVMEKNDKLVSKLESVSDYSMLTNPKKSNRRKKDPPYHDESRKVVTHKDFPENRTLEEFA